MSDPHGSGRFRSVRGSRRRANSHFAWVRTRFAVERTLMAYMRTAVSLIGFGFAIVQFFDRMHQMPGVSTARYSDAAWYLGLALILCGVIAMVISLRVYRWTLRYLWSEEFATVAGLTTGEGKPRCTRSPSPWFASAPSPFLPCCCVSCSGPHRKTITCKTDLKSEASRPKGGARGTPPVKTNLIEAFKKYPTRQEPASFNLDALMRTLEDAGGGANH